MVGEIIANYLKISKAAENINTIKNTLAGRSLQLTFGKSKGDFTDEFVIYAQEVMKTGEELVDVLDRIATTVENIAKSFKEADTGLAGAIVSIGEAAQIVKVKGDSGEKE